MMFAIRRPSYTVLSKYDLEISIQEIQNLIDDLRYLENSFRIMYKEQPPGLFKDAMGCYIHNIQNVIDYGLSPLIKGDGMTGKTLYSAFLVVGRETNYGYLIYIANLLCEIFKIVRDK